MASHRAVSQKLGQELSIHRWRGNVWFDGLPLWEEFEWLGRDVQIGEAVLRGPRTLQRDAAPQPPTLKPANVMLTLWAALSGWGHQDFGVYAEVLKGGEIRVGDKVQLL